MKKKILVIEDDVFISSLITGELADEDYDVQSAMDGPSGLAAAREQKPDLILLDILMPQMEGFEVLTTLKSDSAASSIPVVVLSNFGQPEDIKRAKDAGAVDFLVKVNFTPKEIGEKIRKILESSDADAQSPSVVKVDTTLQK